ncbi:MAG: hypothetical protein NTZ60_02510 [Campylobacterales bacterium]|nr:hypothetical protein [Campylobacterales bacterium]
MTKITPSNLEQIVSDHVNEVKKYINFDALQNREKKYIKQHLDDILRANPKELDNIINNAKFHNIDSDRLKKTFVGGSKYGGSIGYTKFSSKNIPTYNAYDLAQSLNVNVCPYCNRNYTFTIKNKHAKSTRPDFDHFYDKDTYPILALSFYNLIPSCILCNSRLKSTAKFSTATHLHPYQESFNNYAKFKLNIENSSFYYDEKGFDIELKTSDKRAENIKEAFALEVLYKEHKDIVLELIQKAEIYNDSYIDELMQKYEGTLFKNREDLLRLVTYGYVSDEDLHKRPLSKLIKDISEELKLL